MDEVTPVTLSIDELLRQVREWHERIPHYAMTLGERVDTNISGPLREQIPEIHGQLTFQCFFDGPGYDIGWNDGLGQNRRHIYWAGEKALNYVSNDRHHIMMLADDPERAMQLSLNTQGIFVPLNYIFGYGQDYHPFYEILGRVTGDLALHPVMERVGADACYMIEGQTPYGCYKVWIDPAHGFQPVKAESEKRQGDLHSTGKPIKDRRDTFLLDQVEVQQVGEFYFLKKARRGGLREDEDGSQIEITSIVTLDGITLHPDFLACGAFTTDWIPDETEVTFLKDLPMTRPFKRQLWRDVKLREEWGK
jgi:hypothetical protein